MRAVNFTYTLQSFQRKLKDEVKSFQEVCKEILIEGVNSLLSNLAKYTPPNPGANTIRKAMYYRPIIPLKELCSKEGYNRNPCHRC